MGLLKTEVDPSSKHPELGFKVLILDMTVEHVSLPASGLEGQEMGLQSRCNDGEECLYFETEGVCGGLKKGQEAACRLFPPVLYIVYSLQKTNGTTETFNGRISPALAAETYNLDTRGYRTPTSSHTLNPMGFKGNLCCLALFLVWNQAGTNQEDQ